MTDRYSFVCNGGCGVCGVKVIPFESSRTETLAGELLDVKFKPQIVSACCGQSVGIYDNVADTWLDDEVELNRRATPAPAQPEPSPGAEGDEAWPRTPADFQERERLRRELWDMEHGDPWAGMSRGGAAAPVEGAAWQPIETALKDGSEVLAWESGIGRIILFFQVSKEAPEGVWIDGLSGENFHPSQWWPVLPAAPKEKP